MGSHPIPAKRFRISVEESAVDQQQQEARWKKQGLDRQLKEELNLIQSRPQKRWLCNELVHELCLEMPTAKTSDRILLTTRNMYAYLTPQFSKKLIYRDAIAFLKAKLKAKKNIGIRIDQVSKNKESEPIVVLSQEQWEDEGKTIFELETNQFCVQIWHINHYRNMIHFFDTDDQYAYHHLQYFLRLIAPLLQPIQLDLNNDMSHILIAGQHFLNSLCDWTDWIGLWDHQFSSEPIYEALAKCNKLQIYGPIRPDVPKLIHWLTSNNNNNGQQKKCLFCWNLYNALDSGLALLIEELKKEFACATSKSRFFIRLKLRQQLNEFTMCNELTGEKLKMRHIKNIEDEISHFHALSRFSNNGLDDNENNDCMHLGGTGVITTMVFI